MLTSIQGIYRNGKIELVHPPISVHNETPVIVTFLESNSIDLHTRGINETMAANLRARLATFAEDWNSPEMDIYNDYDEIKANLQTR